MMRKLAIAFLLISLSSILSAQDKKRVAVLDFEYGTVASYVDAIFGGHYDVGIGIRDILVEKLVRGGVYSVIERSALEAVLKEQNFSNSDRANPTSAAQLGKVLGVDVIIIGSITQFGRDDQSQTIGGAALASRTFGFGGIKRKKAKAVTGITARMIDVNTAEILGVSTGFGESTRSGTALIGGGAGGGNAGAGGYDMSSSNFANSILGEAVHAAVEPVARELESFSGNVPTTKLEVSGLIADFTDGIAIINVGSGSGIKVGDRLLVKRPVREIRDPATGKVLRSIEDSIGELVITEVDAGSAVGQFSGSEPAKVGDAVRN
jgi:curli biogenesis system outer membrane secretion channel CsgG